MSSSENDNDGRSAAASQPPLDDAWDPADGPPPTEQERAEAAAFASALATPPRARASEYAPGVRDAVELALRARAAHEASVPAARVQAVAREAVAHAVAQGAATRTLRTRGRWLALVAALVVGAGGLQVATLRRAGDGALDPAVAVAVLPGEPVSRPVGAEVFRAPLPENPRSFVTERLAQTRLRAYRQRVLFSSLAPTTGGAR